MPLGGVRMNFLPFLYQQRESGIHTFSLSKGHLIYQADLSSWKIFFIRGRVSGCRTTACRWGMPT